MKKIIFSIFMFLLFISCSNKSENKNLKSFTYNAVAEGRSFDPQLLTDGNTMTIHGLVSEGLTYTKASGEVIPGLAKSWDISEDGLIWTFHLKDDLKWSDGRKLTADDFIFAWERALNPEVASEYSYMLFVIKNAEKYNKGEVSLEEVGFKAIDEKTIEVRLENITPYFDSLVSFVTYMPASREFANEKGSEYGLEADSLLYSGPYKVESWDHNTEMRLVRNEFYSGSNPRKVDEVRIKYISDPTSVLNAFKNEELDIANLTAEQYQEFENDKRVRRDGLARTVYLTYNLDSELFKNENLRRAISIAVNKEELIKSVFNGVKEAAYTFTPKNVGMLGLKDDFVKELGNVFENYNPEKSKELLNVALKELKLEKLPTLVLLADERGNNKKVAEKIQEDLRVNLGLDVRVDVVTFKERLNRTSSREFDILLNAWGADYQDPMTFLDLLMTRSSLNASHYNSKEYDNLIETAMKTTDKTVRIESFFKAEKLLAKDLPIMPLYQETQLHLVSDRLTGLEIGSFGIDLHFLNLDIIK